MHRAGTDCEEKELSGQGMTSLSCFNMGLLVLTTVTVMFATMGKYAEEECHEACQGRMRAHFTGFVYLPYQKYTGILRIRFKLGVILRNKKTFVQSVRTRVDHILCEEEAAARPKTVVILCAEK
jgi:hypothetical protein